jgi:DNA-binding CsgD family transcriptional regulator
MLYTDKQWLKEQYVDKKRAMLDIAKELNVSTMTIRKYVLRYGFKIRNKNQQRSLFYSKEKQKTNIKINRYSSSPKDALLANKDWLYDQYIVQKKSIREIADILNKKGRRTIFRALEYHNIPIRNLISARSNRTEKGPELRSHTNPLANDLIHIEQLYESGKSIREIAEELDISYTAITHRLNTANISRRDPWKHRIGVKHSIETKNKMSKTAINQICNGKRTSHSNAIRHIVCNGKSIIRVRSTYEKKYAEYLKQSNIEFTYEPKSFKLSNGTSYVPDFYLPKEDKFIEIKGYISSEQEAKYELFRIEYPNINWEILYKEDLLKLGINLNILPTVYMLIGAPAAGKSWIAKQLLDKFDYISYDDNKKKKHLDLLRTPSNKPKLYDPTFKISTIIRRHSDEFNFIIIAIEESEEVLRERINSRNGKWTDTILKRNIQIRKRFEKYGNGGMIGTSNDVLNYLLTVN